MISKCPMTTPQDIYCSVFNHQPPDTLTTDDCTLTTSERTLWQQTIWATAAPHPAGKTI
jgi:hypothetical protein